MNNNRLFNMVFIVFSLLLLTTSVKSAAESGSDNIIYLPLIQKPPSWEEVGEESASNGGISNTNGYSVLPSLSIAPDGTPYVAWRVFSGSAAEIYARAWNGSNWVEVGTGSASGGGISNYGGESANPSISIAPNGTPYVAWEEWGIKREIYVRAWNGSNWAEIGTGSASGGGISNTSDSSWNPSVAIAPNGTPYVVWSDSSDGNPEIYVRAWNGSIWTEVGAGSASGGGISNTPGESIFPSISVAPNGIPYVVWQEFFYDAVYGFINEIYVRAWNGSSWMEVGIGSASGGGISNHSGFSMHPDITISPKGTPYIAWSDGSTMNFQIYIRAWNGSSWAEVGTGSASGGGISNDAGNSSAPSVAISPDNMPYVAWENYHDNGDAEIYIKSWDGSNWVEVGTGSASNGGISNNTGESKRPFLAIAPDSTLYVVWQDESNGDWEIYVLRYPR